MEPIDASGSRTLTAEDRQAYLRAWGRWIRVLRTVRGLTQEELARQAGLPTSTIGRIERGDLTVGVASVWPLADALGVHPSDLFRVAVGSEAPTAQELDQLLNR